MYQLGRCIKDAGNSCPSLGRVQPLLMLCVEVVDRCVEVVDGGILRGVDSTSKRFGNRNLQDREQRRHYAEGRTLWVGQVMSFAKGIDTDNG